MFTSDHRAALRRQLLGLAEKDPRITGAAVTGSAVGGREDRWSDIDLYFGITDAVALDAVLSDWTDYLYGELAALHHFELKVSAAVYRAFLLPSCIEVDLGFTPADQFGPHGPHFRAVFGKAVPSPLATSSDPAHRIGLAWHHVLHARSWIERQKPWQAEYWRLHWCATLRRRSCGEHFGWRRRSCSASCMRPIPPGAAPRTAYSRACGPAWGAATRPG